MDVVILSSRSLFGGAAQDDALADLWSQMYRTHALTIVQILPSDIATQTDLQMLGCHVVHGRFGSVSVLPEKFDLAARLAKGINSSESVLVCLADDTLAPLAVQLRRLCPHITLCMFARHDQKTEYWRIFKDLFHHVTIWPKKGVSSVRKQLVEIAGTPSTQSPSTCQILKRGTSFNPLTRFFSGHFLYWDGATDIQFGANLTYRGGELGTNIYVEMIEAGDNWQLWQLKTILPKGYTPQDFNLKLTVNSQGEQPIYDGGCWKISPLAKLLCAQTCRMTILAQESIFAMTM